MAQISKEYASALFELARETKNEAAYLQALQQIEREFSENEAYLDILESPAIAFADREQMLTTAFGGRGPEQVLSFLLLLCQRGRIRIFGECVREYEQQLDLQTSHVTARVTSAAPLSDAQKTALMEKLETISGRSVDAQSALDEALIGGFVVQMDDLCIDASIRRQLKEVKEAMVK